MNQLLLMLNYIILSELERKLLPETWLRKQLPYEWRQKHNMMSKSELFLQHFRMYQESNRHISMYSSHSNNIAPYQLPVQHQSGFLPRYPTLPLPPPIVRTSHSNAPAPFMIIPPFIPQNCPPFVPPVIPHLPLSPVLMNNSNPLKKRKASLSSISKRPKNKIKISIRNIRENIEPTLNLSISGSSCSDEVKDSVLPGPSMASAPSSSAPVSTPPSTDNTSDAEDSTCFPKTSESLSDCFFTLLLQQNLHG